MATIRYFCAYADFDFDFYIKWQHNSNSHLGTHTHLTLLPLSPPFFSLTFVGHRVKEVTLRMRHVAML